jgi:hypothetical protein
MIPKVIVTLDDNGNVVSSVRANDIRVDSKNSTFNLFDSYKSIAITSKSVMNLDKFEFNERFSDILSEAITTDNRYLLSTEQKKLIDRYFAAATGDEAKTEAEILVLLSSEDLKQLDIYLGGI